MTYFRNPWQLRYKLYVVLVLSLLPALLHSASFFTKANVPVDSGYKVVETNVFAQKIEPETPIIAFISTNSSLVPKEKPIPNTVLVENGQLIIYDADGGNITGSFADSEIYKLIYNTAEVKIQPEKPKETVLANLQKPKVQSIAEIKPKPDAPNKRNLLIYPEYKIQSPIQYATLEDLYIKDAKGNFKFNEPIDQYPTTSPVQQKLINGIVHLGNTVQPGEVGNSYIVGHSSNYSYVKSDYNYVFKPLESASHSGQDFFIFDKDGRELKFCVFDAVKILDDDVVEAYKDFGSKRVVTLQTSILGWRNGQLMATHRWLTRGELCN